MSETMMAQGRAEVDEANRRFMEAMERGDAASVAALYAEDAVVLPPDAPMVSGRSAIEQFWRGMMGAGARGVNLAALVAISLNLEPSLQASMRASAM
jgi:uncharacterized protein (TIGR02246 family)